MIKKTFEQVVNDLDFDKEKIGQDLSAYYIKAQKDGLCVGPLLELLGNVENYVDILYWMKFVKRLNPTEMMQVIPYRDLPKCYTRLAWNYNVGTLAECEQLEKERVQKLIDIYNSYDYDDPVFSSDDFLEKTKESRGAYSKKALQYIGHYADSEEDLIRKLYYLIYVKELSVPDIARIFGKSDKAIQNLANKSKLQLSLKEAQQRAAKTRDYSAGFLTHRKTRVQNLRLDGLHGSHIENLIRTCLEAELVGFLGTDDFEIIVGLNTISIIPPQEVDVPVVLIEKKTQQVHRFAVEINGKFWHKKEINQIRDERKSQKLNDINWDLVVFNVENSATYANEMNDHLKSLARGIANEIVSRLVNNGVIVNLQKTNEAELLEKSAKTKKEDNLKAIQIHQSVKKEQAPRIQRSVKQEETQTPHKEVDQASIIEALQNDIIRINTVGVLEGAFFLVPFEGRLDKYTKKPATKLLASLMQEGEEQLVAVFVVEEDELIFIRKRILRKYATSIYIAGVIELKETHFYSDDY